MHSGAYGGDISYYNLTSRNVLAFSREKDGSQITCIFNMCKRDVEVSLADVIKGEETVLLHGANGQVDLEDCPVETCISDTEHTVLPPWGFDILSDK